MNQKIAWYDVIAFFLEIAAIVLIVRAGLELPFPIYLKVVLIMLFLGLFISLWAGFLAPKASRRLHLPWLALGKFALLAVSGVSFLLRAEFLLFTGWIVLVAVIVTITALTKHI